MAMGRVVPDSRWYFHIADMAVLHTEPSKKGHSRSTGDAVLRDLLRYIRQNAADGEPYVNLLADPPGRSLYRKNGFAEAAALDEVRMVLKAECLSDNRRRPGPGSNTRAVGIQKFNLDAGTYLLR